MMQCRKGIAIAGRDFWRASRISNNHLWDFIKFPRATSNFQRYEKLTWDGRREPKKRWEKGESDCCVWSCRFVISNPLKHLTLRTRVPRHCLTDVIVDDFHLNHIPIHSSSNKKSERREILKGIDGKRFDFRFVFSLGSTWGILWKSLTTFSIHHYRMYRQDLPLLPSPLLSVKLDWNFIRRFSACVERWRIRAGKYLQIFRDLYSKVDVDLQLTTMMMWLEMDWTSSRRESDDRANKIWNLLLRAHKDTLLVTFLQASSGLIEWIFDIDEDAGELQFLVFFLLTLVLFKWWKSILLNSNIGKLRRRSTSSKSECFCCGSLTSIWSNKKLILFHYQLKKCLLCIFRNFLGESQVPHRRKDRSTYTKLSSSYIIRLCSLSSFVSMPARWECVSMLGCLLLLYQRGGRAAFVQEKLSFNMTLTEWSWEGLLSWLLQLCSGEREESL